MKPKITAGAVTSKRLVDKLELERFRAAGKAAASRARATRQATLRAGLQLAVNAHAAALAAMPPHSRAAYLHRRIEVKGSDVFGLAAVPSLKTIRRFIKQKINGCS